MALLEESLVEEYYRRKGYFTIRGLKCGSKNKEIDLLCLKPNSSYLDCIHVEVHVSYKPVSYISNPSQALRDKFNYHNSANRSDVLLEACITEWISSKYHDISKDKARKLLAPNSEWKFIFVCGEVRESRELQLLENKGITVKSWQSIVEEFLQMKKVNTAFSSDITELLLYAKKLDEIQTIKSEKKSKS